MLYNRPPGHLLHIMRYYDDGKLFPELRYPFLHLLSGYRIES